MHNNFNKAINQPFSMRTCISSWSTNQFCKCAEILSLTLMLTISQLRAQ